MKPKALIFTKRVLPMSNTFVASQGNGLNKYQPIFIGLRNDKTGVSLIENQTTCVQENVESFPKLARLLLDGAQILMPRWAESLSSLNADIIHANFGKGGYYCSPISKRLEIPLVTTFHGSDITQKDKFSYNSKHRNKVFNSSNKIIAVSKFIQNKLLKAGCPEDKIIQHYIGIDNDYFSPSSKKDTCPTILFVGRLIKQKGCQYLIEAMKTVNKRIPEAKLVIVGYGNYEETLKDLASNLHNVSFVGAKNRSQVKELMSTAWITCLPSIRMARGNEEGMPTVCVESQAVGTPVVAFDTGGVGEGISDQETGLLSPEKDSNQLADNLLTLLESTSLRDKMGQQGVARINDIFNIKKQTEKLEDIYTSLL